MNRRILHRLIWKDARSLMVLVAGTSATVIGLNVLSGFFVAMSDGNASIQMSLAYAIWFMLPALVAFGAPSLLVGGEEESGSLAWLRTLPASWGLITASKLIVALLMVFFVGLVATGCYLMQWASLSGYWAEQLRRAGDLPEPLWVHGFGALLIWVAVMLCSFTTAYLFRSPIAALLAAIPLFVLTISLVFTIAGNPEAIRLVNHPDFQYIDLMPLFTTALLALMGLLAASVTAAWFRLSRVESLFSSKVHSRLSDTAYRPPSELVALSHRTVINPIRPGRIQVLLWQQIRPIRWLLISFIAVGMLGLIYFRIVDGPLGPLGIIALVGSTMLIASLTFYGDSVRKRCLFLHDRGISPTLIWLTRVVPMMLVCLAIFVVMIVSLKLGWPNGETDSAGFSQSALAWFSIGIAIFAMNQLVSQWSPRPTLAFFAGPVLVHIAGFILAAIFFAFPDRIGVLILSAAVLLFASWRLMPGWLSAEPGRGDVARFLGYIALAVVLPYLVVLGTRWSTMPSQQSAWRERALSMTLPTGSVDLSDLDPYEKVMIPPGLQVRRLESIHSWGARDLERSTEVIAKELASDADSKSGVTFQDLLQVIFQTPSYSMKYHYQMFGENGVIFEHPPVHESEESSAARQQQFDAVRVLLKWSRLTREQAVVGNASFPLVQSVAEHADLIATRVLTAYVDEVGVTDEIADLISALPDPGHIRQSRANSLVRSWRAFQDPNAYSFAGHYVYTPRQWWLAVERTRSRRQVDQLTQLILRQLDDGGDFASPEFLDRVKQIEDDAYLLDESYESALYQGLSLNEQLAIWGEVDQNIKRLQTASSTQ